MHRLPRQRRHFASLLPAGLTGYLLVKGQHPTLPGWPCPLQALTGIPCPTCFLSRTRGTAGPDSDLDLLVTLPDTWLES